jgi:hypothetical protein
MPLERGGALWMKASLPPSHPGCTAKCIPGSFGLQMLMEGQSLGVVEVLLHSLQSERRKACNPIGDLTDVWQEFIMRQQPADQSDPEGLLGVDPVRQQVQLTGLGAADDAGQGPCTAEVPDTAAVKRRVNTALAEA